MTVKPGKDWKPSGKNMWKYDKNTSGTVVTYVNRSMIFKSRDKELNNTPCDDELFKNWCIVIWDTPNGQKRNLFYRCNVPIREMVDKK